MSGLDIKIEIDEDTLKQIAEKTGGEYFRATDTDSLKNIYARIDKLEKVKFEETGYRQVREYFDAVLLAALAVLAGQSYRVAPAVLE